ncbi:MAG: succinate dehydrogenase assembly factor 2 [Pseudomonadota bacterium]
MTTPQLDVRRRRALFRAMHRGTKEMDWMLGRYATARLAEMPDDDLETFEQLLSIADPDINAWLIDPALVADRLFGPLVSEIRTFHGLDDLATSSSEPDTTAGGAAP